MGEQDGKKENSIVDIKKYFSTSGEPLTTKEFTDFWNSCSEEEKDEFRKADLSK